jgi:ABC-type branched-subunit amino acid transport system substrate-binding protein
MLRKNAILWRLHILSASLLLHSFLFSVAEADSRLKVGVIAGFTGDWSAYGVAYRQGIELAAVDKDVNFIYEDDGFDSKKTVAAFRKLADIDKVDAVIVGDTTTALSVAPLAENAKVFVLVWGGDLPELKNKYVLRIAPDFAVEMDFISKVINKDLKTLTLVSAHGYAGQWGTELKKLSKNFDLEQFATDPSDYKPILLKSKLKHYDQIAICLNPGQNGLLISQARQLGLTQKYFGCNMLESNADLSSARGAMEGVVFESTEVTDEFTKSFHALAKTNDHLVAAALHYDAAKLLARASKEKGATIRDRILAVPPFAGAHTKVEIKKDATGDGLSFKLPYTLYEIKNGQMTKKSE